MTVERWSPIPILLGCALAGGPASAQAPGDSGAFVVRLGDDTLALERYVRTGNRIESMVVTRSPRTTIRHLVFVLAPDGSVSRAAVAPAGRPLEERDNPQAGTIPLAGFWVSWELVVRQAHRSPAEVTEVRVLTGDAVRPTPVRRVGPSTYRFASQFDQPMEARVDESGRLLSIDVDGGTTVRRVPALDLERWAGEFAARDEAGRGLGPLSPRETVERTVAGARIVVEYGRPSLRGRPLETLVPLGQVWRTGANDASTLTTDQPLRFDGLTLEPGTYSIFTLPEAGGWTLIVNRQTGMSGLDRNPAQDFGRVPMRIRTDAPHTEQFTIALRDDGEGGALVLAWGRVEAVARFRRDSPAR